MIGKLIKKYKEVIMYLVFGVLTTLVNWICYALLTKKGINMNVSNVIAWIVAVLFAFITNKLFVFESKNLEIRFVCMELVKFTGARLATGVIEILGLPALYYLGVNQSLFGVEGFLAKVLVSVVVVILNYIFSKLFIFREKREK